MESKKFINTALRNSSDQNSIVINFLVVSWLGNRKCMWCRTAAAVADFAKFCTRHRRPSSMAGRSPHVRQLTAEARVIHGKIFDSATHGADLIQLIKVEI